MSFFTKVRNYMLGADYEDDDEFIEEYEEDIEPDDGHYRAKEKERERERERERDRDFERDTYSSIRTSRKYTPDTKVINMPQTPPNTDAKVKVVICRPEVVDDATSICEHLKNDIICVVNLEGVERTNAQRIADFLGGSCFALSGEIQRVSNEIFLVAPSSIGISSELKEELKANGLILPWISSAFK